MSAVTSLPDARRRAAITGIGAIAATGVGTEGWWEATKRGTPGIRRISRFDPSRYATRYAGEVEGFEATDHIDRRIVVQTDRWTWMGLAAAQMALDDARLDPAAHDPYSMGVITASSSGGNEFGQVEIQNLWGKGPGFVGAYQSIAWFYAATTGQISIRHQMKGPCGVVAAEGAGGLEALAHARRTIRRGLDIVVGGGVEAPIGPYALTCQMASGKLSAADDPASYRPFDARACGWVPGEGGAILLVEDLESARRRGARHVYGTIEGCGATHDPRQVNGGGAAYLARAIRAALADAGIGAEDVDVVFADGSGVPAEDAREAAALRDVFTARSVPVTVPKTMVGRLHAGGAALDVAAALLAMRDGCIPPSVNLDPDGCGLDLVVDRARPAEIETALVIARGHGGFNRALVLRAGELRRVAPLPRRGRCSARSPSHAAEAEGETVAVIVDRRLADVIPQLLAASRAATTKHVGWREGPDGVVVTVGPVPSRPASAVDRAVVVAAGAGRDDRLLRRRAQRRAAGRGRVDVAAVDGVPLAGWEAARLGRLVAGTRIGLSLGAGGALGFAHVGVIDVLQGAGHAIDVVGSSIGACSRSAGRRARSG